MDASGELGNKADHGGRLGMKCRRPADGVAASPVNHAGHGPVSKSDDDYEHMVPQLDDLLSPDEMEELGDLGNEGDDLDSPEVARLASLPLSPRQFLLLHRMDQAIKQFKAALRAKQSRMEASAERVPEEVWRRLGDDALGIASEPDDLESKVVELSRQLAVAKSHLARVRHAAHALARLADEQGTAATA